MHIPCHYGRQLNLERVANQLGLTSSEVIRWHSATVYTVYAIGFCPGFPYLGYLPPALTGVPRLATPRLRVEAGSVGLTGRQTAIYTEPRPGGWCLIGQTPLHSSMSRPAISRSVPAIECNLSPSMTPNIRSCWDSAWICKPPWCLGREMLQ